MSLPPLATRLREHPENLRILAWLGVRTDGDARIEPWVDHGFDVGAQTLFHQYAAALPGGARYAVSSSAVLVHPDSAVVYAVLFGRFTFLVRRPHGAPPHPRVGETLDGMVRLDGLEDEWTIVPHEEEAETLLEAHSAAASRDV